MDQVILDLGFNANVLSMRTWERMGKPTLQWSSIQLRMSNQQKIIPLGCMYGVIVDIEGESMLPIFEVIEIVDDNNPYPTLLGIWAFDMDAVINMKKQNMKFETKALRIIVPLDPVEVVQYTELVRDYEEDDDSDQIYKITTCNEDQINPTADGWITWDRDNFCNLDSNEELKHQHNRWHEVSMLHCNMMTKSLQ